MDKISRVIHQHGRTAVWLAVAIASLFLIVATSIDFKGVGDFGNLVLNLVLLAITATTLHLAIPDRARLQIDHQGELGIDDLIFYVVGDSEQGIPRDVLMQLHIAVSNVGGRKAVLSRLELEALLNDSGAVIDLGFGKVRAMQYLTRNQWLDTIPLIQGQKPDLQKFTIRDELPGPFTLAPDDVITLRLRARRGVDWTDRWTLDALRSLASSLEKPITSARVAATYRRGDELLTERFSVPVRPVQQKLYLDALRFKTDNLSKRPEIDPMPIRDM